MLTGLRTRLRHSRAGTPPPGEIHAEEDGWSPDADVEVEFAAYAEDCRIFGFWRHGAERMSDALNQAEAYGLKDVLVAALDDGRTMEARELMLPRDELVAVRAAGTRGNVARRTRVRPSPITLQAGPYVIHGYIHAPPGADPLRHIRQRKPLVPLTEAWIEYASSGQPHRGRVGVIIVNVDWMEWVRMSRDDEVRLPGLSAEAAIDPRAKDLTGYIHTS